jgi:hypothetical protein
MANNTLTKLQTVTVGAGGSASVTFSAIPQTYTDLVIKVSARTGNASATDSLIPAFNSFTSNFNTIYLYGNPPGSNALSGTSTNFAGFIDGASSTASTFANTELYISNYTSSNIKSYSVDSVQENNSSSGFPNIVSGLWSNINPITSITLSGAGSFVQYSTFTLYGVYAGGVTTPSAPTIASATDIGGGTAQVAISSPSAIPYTVTSSPGGITATGMSPINISGLSPQTSYTFTAQAVAPFGTSSASSASSSVSMYNGMTALATATGTGSSGVITFSSIPSGYTHLQIRGIARGTQSATNTSTALTFNGDTATNYSWHNLTGDGSTATAGGSATQANIYSMRSPAASALANTYNVFVMDILDYGNTNKYKTIRILQGYDLNGSGYSEMFSGNWRSTSAITSLTFTLASGSYTTGSTFVLYGVK